MARRKTYDQRTRADTKGAKLLAKAFNEKPLIVEDKKTGEVTRLWRPEEARICTNKELTDALRNVRAIEEADLGLLIPPSGIKDAVSRKWLVRAGTMLWVTEKCAEALKLPRKANGLTIKVHKGQ